jgi:hypothetical protein
LFCAASDRLPLSRIFSRQFAAEILRDDAMRDVRFNALPWLLEGGEIFR